MFSYDNLHFIIISFSLSQGIAIHQILRESTILVETIIGMYTCTNAQDVWIRISKLSIFINIDNVFNTIILLVVLFLNVLDFIKIWYLFSKHLSRISNYHMLRAQQREKYVKYSEI